MAQHNESVTQLALSWTLSAVLIHNLGLPHRQTAALVFSSFWSNASGKWARVGKWPGEILGLDVPSTRPQLFTASFAFLCIYFGQSKRGLLLVYLKVSVYPKIYHFEERPISVFSDRSHCNFSFPKKVRKNGREVCFIHPTIYHNCINTNEKTWNGINQTGPITGLWSPFLPISVTHEAFLPSPWQSYVLL